MPNDAPPTSALAWRFLALLAVALLALAAYGGYAVGRHRDAGRVLHGRAFVAEHQAVVIVDRWAYDLPVGTDPVPWFDATGGEHIGSVAPCLAKPQTTPRITFAEGSVRVGNATQRTVLWVRCD